jgi:pimeloyl-ACP methyl ester carboxylesterase
MGTAMTRHLAERAKRVAEVSKGRTASIGICTIVSMDLVASRARLAAIFSAMMVLWMPLPVGPMTPYVRGSEASDRGTIELNFPLKDGRFYRIRDVYAECNRKLGAHFSLDAAADRVHELSVAETLALAWLQQTNALEGMLEVRLEPSRLTLRIADGEHPEARRRVQRLVERLVAVPITQWPADKGLHLPDGLVPGRPTAILIHGLAANADAMGELSESLRKLGVQVVLFDYPNRQPIATSGARLREELLAVQKSHPELQVAIIAHSMGGLVARYALEADGAAPANVTDLVTLGTPHHGSALADKYAWMELYRFAVHKLRGEYDRKADLLEGLGEAGDDLCPNSRFLQDLNACRRPATVRYHCAAGCAGYFSADERQTLRADLQRHFDAHPGWGLMRRGILSIIDTDELRAGEGDGAVSVASALLNDAHTKQRFEVNHVDLIESRGAGEAVFEWIVATLKWSSDDARR